MRKKERLILLAICSFAAFLRLYRIGHQSLWIDEIFTLTMSNPKPGLNIWDYLRYNIHGPLHSFVVFLFHYISVSDGWLRLPSAIAGIGAVIFFFRWISLWISSRVALLAAALLAVNPMHVYYSQELRNYSFLLFFAMIANYFFHRILKEESRRFFVYFSMSTALAALSNFSAAFLFAAHTVIFFIHKKVKRKTILQWLFVCIAVLVLISPWVYRINKIIDFSQLLTPVMPGQIETSQRLRGGTTINMSSIPYTLYTFSAGYSLGPSLRFLHEHASIREVLHKYAAWVILVSLSFGIPALIGYIKIVKDRRFWRELSLYLIFPVLFTIVLCWQNAKAFNPRYVILALPAYLCILSAGLLGIRSAFARNAALAIVLALSLLSIWNYYYNGNYARENVKAAARYVESRIEGGECILAPTVKGVVEHYLDNSFPIYSVNAPRKAPRNRIDRQLDGVFNECASLWYFRARPWVDDPNGYVLNALESRYDIKVQKEFEGVRLIHFARKQDTSREIR
jgi:predicted membrane-bound mannosyltransferase